MERGERLRVSGIGNLAGERGRETKERKPADFSEKLFRARRKQKSFVFKLQISSSLQIRKARSHSSSAVHSRPNQGPCIWQRLARNSNSHLRTYRPKNLKPNTRSGKVDTDRPLSERPRPASACGGQSARRSRVALQASDQTGLPDRHSRQAHKGRIACRYRRWRCPATLSESCRRSAAGARAAAELEAKRAWTWLRMMETATSY